MRTSTLLTVAVLGAALLPLAGARAEDTTSTTTTTTTTVDNVSTAALQNTIMDAGLFRGNLHSVRDLFSQIRSNSTLALASADPLIQSQLENDNKRLVVRAINTLQAVSNIWRKADIPSLAGQTASLDSGTERYGTANAVRFANESPDTAFVRNTVWELLSRLQADKLNGRDPIITSQMMSMLDAAISRADNPDFRVAQAVDMSRLRSMQIAFSEGYQPPAVTPSTRAGAAAPAENNWQYQQVYLEHNNLPSRNQVAQTTTTETTEETPVRAGAANTLPQTGGDPSLLYMFGSGLAGLGAILRRRRS